MPKQATANLLDTKQLTALKRRASAVLSKLADVHPDPKCELYYQTPYQLLVSVVLSAQTTDKSVNRCMIPLYQKDFTPEILLKMGQQKFQQAIKTIGLAPTKAKNVVALSKIIIEQHEGQVPNDRTSLEALPGVGRKTANVILGEIFGQPTLAVDTHVFRVGKRLALHNATTPEKAELALLKVVAARHLPAGHHLFILHGRYTCTARNPKCHDCVLRKMCHSPEKISTKK